MWQIKYCGYIYGVCHTKEFAELMNKGIGGVGHIEKAPPYSIPPLPVYHEKNLLSLNMYKAEDFNTENAPKEMVQYIIDNVVDFGPRYQHALSIIGRDRCPLRMAYLGLYEDIEESMAEWCHDHDFCVDLYDIEEIFG
jgi:hypothetical protein